MATTSIDLIRSSFELATILDPEEEMSSPYARVGLNVLNKILTEWSNLQVYIPYTRKVTVPVQYGVYQYTVAPKIVELFEAQLFSQSGVLYQITPMDVFEFNVSNFNDLKTIPQRIYFDTSKSVYDLTTGQEATTFYLYPNPGADFTLNMIVKEVLAQVTLSEELLSIPLSYEKVLNYQVADDLADIYAVTLPDKFDRKLAKLVREMQATNPKDLHLNVRNDYNTYPYFRPRGRSVY